MKRWRPFGLAVVPATVVALVVLFMPSPSPPPAAPTPTRDWTKCVARDPRACTTVDGIPLGLFEGAVSLDTPPCDSCSDSPGTARAALEQLAPHHPPLTAIDMFGPDLHVLCGDTPCLSFGWQIFVFTFSDGTTRPIVVLCGATVSAASCKQVDHYGPPY